MFELFTTMHLTTALLCLTIAVLAVRAMRRGPSWRPLPGWSFVAFVAVDGLMSVQRVGMPLLPHWNGWWAIGTTMDLVAAALLALVFVQATRRSRVALLVVEEAQRSADEYDRARRDYEQLVRHRIGNPLAVVRGVAHTLDSHPDLPEETRRELIRSMVVAAEDLVDVSLDPRSRGAEERDLHALPRVVAPPRSLAGAA